MVFSATQKTFAVVLLAVAWLFLGTTARAVYEVPIYEPGMQKFIIGVPLIKDTGGGPANAKLAKKMRDLLVDDLLLSGYFDVIDPALHLEKPEAQLTPDSFDFGDWSVLRADLLIKGGFSLTSDGLAMELRLFDVVGRKQSLGKRYNGKQEDYPSMIHRFANEVIKLLTGQLGIFGSQIAFVSTRSGNKEIYTIGINGDGLTKITSRHSITISPRWSPDGKWISFTSYVDGQTILFKAPSGGGGAQVLSRRPGLNLGAVWSPDGRTIALTLSQDGNSELYLIDEDGKIITRLTVSWSIEVSPTWSPDGKRLAFVSDRTGKPQIYIINRDGTGISRLTFKGSYNVSPAWSPTEDLILFQGLEGGTYQIYMTDPEAKMVYRVSDGIGSNEDASWSPDGRAIVYNSNRSGTSNLYISNIDGSFTKQLTSGNWNDSSPAWSPRLLK